MIQPGVGGHEEVPVGEPVAQAPDPVVTGEMLASSGVVADDRRQVADLKGFVVHGGKQV